MRQHSRYFGQMKFYITIHVDPFNQRAAFLEKKKWFESITRYNAVWYCMRSCGWDERIWRPEKWK